ncbi:MAG: 16S rRNA (uracil(1498)-N(3))-methyltransferase [Clostridiales bacterium]|nr:16S rRNA (uracil(1498)-N(3))-methyltransferase [Clostridiales bacterium]
MHTFFLERPGMVGEMVPLAKDEANHAIKVLRLSDGETICALDGSGRRFCADLRIREGKVFADIDCEMIDNEPSRSVTLYQGLPKADKLEWIAQKGTELGMKALVPVAMRYSVAKAGKDAARHVERLERISREAVKQCRRARTPEILPTVSFTEALKRMARHDCVLVPYEKADDRTIPRALARAGDARDIGIVIGPEGGIAPEEIEALEQSGAITVTLGLRILRTETAALAALVLALQE